MTAPLSWGYWRSKSSPNPAVLPHTSANGPETCDQSHSQGRAKAQERDSLWSGIGSNENSHGNSHHFRGDTFTKELQSGVKHRFQREAAKNVSMKTTVYISPVIGVYIWFGDLNLRVWKALSSYLLLTDCTEFVTMTGASDVVNSLSSRGKKKISQCSCLISEDRGIPPPQHFTPQIPDIPRGRAVYVCVSVYP